MNSLSDFEKRGKRKLVSGEELLRIKGWRSLVLLQFEPQFEFAIYFGIVISFLASVIDAVYAIANDRLLIEDHSFRQYLTSGMYVFDGFYTIDLLLMLVYKSIGWEEIKHLHPERHGLIVLLELLSLLPLELAMDFAKPTFYLVRLRYSYRVIRLWLFIKRKNRVYESVAPSMLMLKIILGFFFASMFTTFIMSPLISIMQQTYIDDLTFLKFLYTITCRITAKGFGEISDDISGSRFVEYLFCVLNVISFILTSYYVSKIACYLIPRIKYQFYFAHNYMRITSSLRIWRSRSTKRTLSNFYRSYEHTFSKYFRVSWENVKTYRDKQVPKDKIPDVMVAEISLDACLVAFKHSHLFRDQDMFFLRVLAGQVTHEHFSPGELIYKKHSMKSCMIYVLFGIIQIISEENSETPILSLSGGTCIGETTLFIDYPATCTVISKTYSEAIILKRKHLAKIYRIYPKICQELFTSVKKRYSQGLAYWTLLQHEKQKKNFLNHNDENVSIIYIKTSLGRLLYDQKTKKEKHQILTQHKLNQLFFCPYYLDLLVITEDIELLMNSVFIKKKFPFVFRSNSVILTSWDILISLIAIFLVLVYPILLCLLADMKTGKALFNYYCGLVTLFWSVDIYLQMSTAVKTRHYFLTNISSILYYRLTTFSFLVDLCCVLPLGFIVGMVNHNTSTRYLFLLETHKLLKVYRVNKLISKLVQLNSRSLLILKYVKVLVYTALLFYYSACNLYMMLCENTCNKLYMKKISMYYSMKAVKKVFVFLQLYTVASYFINDAVVFNILQYFNNKQHILIFVMQIIYCSCYVYLLADAIAADTVNQQEKHEFKEYVVNLNTIMKKLEFDYSIQERVWTFLKDQYYMDKGTIFLNPAINRKAMSKNLFILHQFIMYGRYLSRIPIFTHLDDSILMEVCKNANVILYSPGQVITYSGEICKEMHLIVSGQCKMVDREARARILKANDHFSVLEICANIPIVHTVITICDCKIISLDLRAYRNLIRKHWRLGQEIEEAVKPCRGRYSHFSYGDEIIKIDVVPERSKKLPSFHRFKSEFQKRSKNYSYILGFNRYSRIFRCFLMPITLTSYGRFLFYYEVCRCVLALVTNFLCSSVIIFDYYTFSFSLLFLDIFAWIDLYLMHHVCYFNEVGLEIYHPWYTAKHYWTHSFLTDLIASLPIDYPFDPHSRLCLYLRLNRILQIRRIASFFNYLNTNNISRTGMFDILKYFPLSLLFINYIAMLFLDANCDIDVRQRPTDECAARLLVGRKMYNTTFSPMNVHASGLILISSTLATIGIARFFMRQYREMIFLDVLVLIAVVFSIWLTTKMVANNFYRNSDLTAYQQAMKQLLTFFNYRKVDKNIKKEIIEHYEHLWERKQCKDLHQMMSYFNTCFKEDLLFDIFGKALEQSWLFPSADKSFYKSLLLKMKHVVLLKRAIVYRVNDVHDDIYFLLNGEVDVLGADYKKLIVLTKGSLFGSLDNAPFMRQTLMMVARSNIELLCIKSNRFYYVLSKYYRLHRHFLYLITLHTDYLKSTYQVAKSKHHTSHAVAAVDKRNFRKMYFKLNPIHKDNKMMRFWELFVLVFVCFIGFHIEIYQKILWDHSFYVIVVLYMVDFLYLMKIYLKFHTAYEDNMGTVVTNRGMIARQYVRSKLEFFVDVVSSVPLEVICLVVGDTNLRQLIFACCRMNRTARIILVYAKLRISSQKLYTNVITMRLLLVFTLLTVYIHVSSGFLVYLRSLLRVSRSNFIEMLSLYENTLMIVIYTTMGSSINNFTVTFNFVIVVYCVLIVLIGRFAITLFIAETCSIMVSVNKNKRDYRAFAVQLKSFINGRDISAPLKEQALDYIRLMWIYHEGVHFPTLLEKAPYYLREATLNAMFGCHLRRHPVLRNCHVDLIRQMAAEMRLVILFPGNCVAYKGDIDNCMYFIHEGVVDALSEDVLSCEVIEQSLFAGDSFGLIQGIHPRRGHDYTYKVRQHSVIIKLDRRKWYYKLCMFPASEEILLDHLKTVRFDLDND